MTSLVVAIDGPAGAGKSTIALRVAERSGLRLVDTGAIYRAVALAARRAGVNLDDARGVAQRARSLDIAFSLDADARNRVQLSGEDVTDAIRTPDNSMAASRVAAHGPVREALLELQRKLGNEPPGAVLEGRDVGTVVFPDAALKFFLTASAEERARRRAYELSERGEAVPYALVLADIHARDRRDTERAVAPLRQAEDARRIDSSTLTLGEVIDVMVAEVEATKRLRAAEVTT